ncbi:hypothetical protein A2U01_0009638, partial [Trifolium medium]|nr:hypothetical protein [Trifolium medium]
MQENEGYREVMENGSDKRCLILVWLST